ncbi:MAG: GAF domain-containing protein [Planctomycetota bacterium]
MKKKTNPLHEPDLLGPSVEGNFKKLRQGITAVHHSDDKTTPCRTTISDITERKRVEGEIQDLAKFSSENPNPVLRVRSDGKLLYANFASESLLGAWQCQTGQNVPEQWRRIASDVCTTGLTRGVEYECRGRVLSFTVAPVAGEDYANLYAHDITGRKLAEEALREAHIELERRVIERTRELMEANQRLKLEIAERTIAEDALRLDEARLETMEKLYTLAVNIPSVQLCDFALEEAVKLTKSKIGFLGFMSADESVMSIHSWSDQAMQKCTVTNKPLSYSLVEAGPWGEAVRQRKPIMVNDYPALKTWKTGCPERHIKVSRFLGTPIFDGDRIVAVVAVANKEDEYVDGDVRQLTLLMNSLWQLIQREQAEEEIRRRQAELAHLNRLGTMGEMASGLAHELNQPLSAVVNYIQAGLERLRRGADEPGELIADMENAAAQAERAGEIIEEIRNFIAKGEPQRRTIDINSLVRKSTGLTKQETQLNKVRINLELADVLPRVVVDPIQIEQVMVNLIHNGLEAMGRNLDGKRVLTIQTLWAGGKSVELAVQDTGPGLSQDDIERVFKPFFTTKADGIGMGLSISRTIIESHGGRLWATSDPGQGATFQFTLPVKEGSH